MDCPANRIVTTGFDRRRLLRRRLCRRLCFVAWFMTPSHSQSIKFRFGSSDGIRRYCHSGLTALLRQPLTEAG